MVKEIVVNARVVIVSWFPWCDGYGAIYAFVKHEWQYELKTMNIRFKKVMTDALRGVGHPL